MNSIIMDWDETVRRQNNIRGNYFQGLKRLHVFLSVYDILNDYIKIR